MLMYNSCFVKFTIAAKDEDRLKDTDFINCIIWNEAAKNFKKIVKKGSYINVIGTLKNRSYTANDVTKYYSEVLVKSFEIVCSPKNDTNVGGDLLNQCIASTFAVRNNNIPYIGIYGACSTFVEGLCLSSLLVNAGYFANSINFSSSHYCSAERQFRLPLEQGSPKPPTSQWTVTAAGCAYITEKKDGPYVTSVTFGKVIDYNISDVANMGAAMAPAAFDTITRHLEETGRDIDYYDYIITGDLGSLGSKALLDLCKKYNLDISKKHLDCGCMIFDLAKEDIHSGGSGCGCISSVFSAYFFKKLKEKEINKILLVATGALMSPVSSMQGETIPSIAHAISIENNLEEIKWN